MTRSGRSSTSATLPPRRSGCDVRLRSEIVDVDDRRVTCRVEAWDEREKSAKEPTSALSLMSSGLQRASRRKRKGGRRRVPSGRYSQFTSKPLTNQTFCSNYHDMKYFRVSVALLLPILLLLLPQFGAAPELF